MLKIVLIVIIATTQCSRSQPCNESESIDISLGNQSANGDIEFGRYVYTTEEYFIDSANKKERGCVCLKSICVNKCCPHGFAYDPQKKLCQPTAVEFALPVYYKSDNIYKIKTENASSVFNFSIRRITCSPDRIRLRSTKVASFFHLIEDGNLGVQMYGKESLPLDIFTPDLYCVDNFVETDEDGTNTTELNALLCLEMDKNDHNYLLTATCMCVSCVFILATVAVYCWLPELRNIHGKVLVAYLLSFFVGFVFLATIQISYLVVNLQANTCLSFTFIIYFFLLAAFFWLNVMCFDIWWKFSTGKEWCCLERLGALSISARFKAYCLYAFGMPTLLTIMLASLEFSGLPQHWYMPKIQLQGCFLYGTSKLLYLYVPITILCVMNMTFFMMTAFRIYTIKKETSILDRSKESAKHDKHRNDKNRFFLYIKLFCVMGINWILEVISSLYPELNSIWQYTDSYNVLIGVIIFIVFVCKRNVLRLIKRRLGYTHKLQHNESEKRDMNKNNFNSKQIIWRDRGIQRPSQDTINTIISVTIDADSSKIKTIS